MITRKQGVTRKVFLTKRYAFKVPNWDSYKQFLQGLLANMQETTFGKCGFEELCPVSWSIPGGWLVVMPRVKPLGKVEWIHFDIEKHFVNLSSDLVEKKIDSFGKLNGKIVAIDYGS